MKAPLTRRSEGRFALASFAGTHFLVDLASVILLFHFLSSVRLFAFCLLFYNFFAFAAEMPLGIVVDLWFKPQRFAALGCWLIVLVYPLYAGLVGVARGSFALALGAAVLVGLGNGMFHVGAGAAVIRGSAGRSAPLGVFVAPGALGVFLGTLWGKGAGIVPVVVAPVLLALCGLLIWQLLNPDEEASATLRRSSSDFAVSLTGAVAVIALACLFLTVSLRSYAGFSFSFSWKTGAIWPAVVVCGVVLGKIAGGLLGDKFGLRVAALISLGGAALLFLFPAAPIVGVLAVLLFNMTMPITLRALADRLPQAPGFAFGLLTFALFLGALPILVGQTQLVRPGWSLAALSMLSLAVLWVGLGKTVRRDR